MAAVTICSDFGAQKNKVWHCFHCFPIYFPWSDGTGCHDLHLALHKYLSEDDETGQPASVESEFEDPSSARMETVLVCCGCYNKQPWTWWLTTTEVFFLVFLEAKSLKSSCQQSLWRFQGRVSSGFWWLQTFLGLWPHPSLLCFHLPPPSSLLLRIPLLVEVSYKDTCNGVEGPPDNLISKSLLNYICKDPFPQ